MFGACYVSAEREQEMLMRMHRIEQKLDIHSTPPQDLEPLRDPFELYDEACKEYYGESSDQPHRRGKQQVDVDDKEYREKDDDDDDNGDDDGGDRDDDKNYDIEQLVLSCGLPLLALVDKGEVLGFDLIVIKQLITWSL